MAEEEAVERFKEGMGLLRNNYASKAIPHFARALELDKSNPFYISYLGVAMAAGQRNWDSAEDLCTQAIKMKRTQPELYLNLGEVYRLAGRRQDAVETLTLGLTMTKRDSRIAMALNKYGFRRPPLLSFLDRDHFLNRELGKLRYRIMKSLSK
ncbi:MAG: tetratricopeptide repeat protein [Terriglobia bacterium]